MFHTLAWSMNNGAAAKTLQAMTPATDPIITQQSSNYVFTDDYNLGLAYGIGATITELRLNMPTVNAYGRHQFWPLDLGVAPVSTIPDRPAIIDYRTQPIKLPRDEQMGLEVSQSGAAQETDNAFAFIFTPNHQWNVPGGIQRLTVRASASITVGTAFTWAGSSALTFQQNLRGGWYSIVGMSVFDANTLAARLIFPTSPTYNGRALRPGCIAQNTVVLRPDPMFDGRLGVWGKFHSFEPPQIEIYANAAAAHASIVVILDLVYHGMGDPANPPMG